MLIISSREFRQNQRKYFDKADKGEQIIVQRGKDKSYSLTPITKEDLYFDSKLIQKIKESLEQAKNGEFKELNSVEDIKDLLGL